MDSMRSPHSPHRVLMESMRSPWILEGLHSAFPNSLHGLYGLHGESMESPCGVYEDSTWSPQVHEDSMKQCFMDSTEIIHGLLMDSPWSPHGVLMESPWTPHGFLMESPWTPHGFRVDSM